MEDVDYLRMAIALAREAKERGDNPFGALLVHPDRGVIAAAGNTQRSDRSALAHAEMNLLARVRPALDSDRLAPCTIFTSAEPCAMCSGAIFWSGIGRLVYGLGGDRLFELAGRPPGIITADARSVLASAGRRVAVVGPLLEEEVEPLFAS